MKGYLVNEQEEVKIKICCHLIFSESYSSWYASSYNSPPPPRPIITITATTTTTTTKKKRVYKHGYYHDYNRLFAFSLHLDIKKHL